MADKQSKKKPSLTALHRRILAALRRNPEGLDIFQIRELVVKDGSTQQHLDRRVRDLADYYDLIRHRDGRRLVYILGDPKPPDELGAAPVSKTVRARALHQASGRCQMCGRTVRDDKIKLEIDHKIPREWGGSSDPENLWAICSECNGGKRNYFATFDTQTMTQVLAHDSVHRRLLALLKLKHGEWVDSDLLEFVANFSGAQQDWQKRLRELRYFGLKIETRREGRSKRSVAYYRLTNTVKKLPEDLTAAARQYERERATRNKRKTAS